MKKCNVLVSLMLTLAMAACGSAGEQGPEGKQGPAGQEGKEGQQGPAGPAGEGCYVVKKDADHGIVICPADGSSYVIYSPENLPKANGLPNATAAIFTAMPATLELIAPLAAVSTALAMMA